MADSFVYKGPVCPRCSNWQYTERTLLTSLYKTCVECGRTSLVLDSDNLVPYPNLDGETLSVDTGSTGTITITLPDDYSPTVTATSSDESIATVIYADGVATVTGVSAGSATITITCTYSDVLTDSGDATTTSVDCAVTVADAS